MEQQVISSDELDAFLGAPPKSSWSRNKKRLLIAGGVLLVLLIGFAIFGRGGADTAYATAPVTRGDLQVRVTATGNLAPTNRVLVGSELSGLIDAVSVDVNDRVVRGQLLAQIDTLKLRDALASSQAALAQAQASVAQSQASLTEANAKLARFREVYRLSGGKVPSSTELDAARAEQGRAQANGRSAQAQVASAQAQVRSDLTNLQKATIRSPVTGVVLARQVEPGQTVAASFNTPTLFEIAEDLSAMKLEVKVDEADVGQVQPGQTASFAVDAFPGVRFPATIQRVNLGSNSSSSSSSGSSSSVAAGGSSSVVSYNAVLTVSNPELRLRPGMTATADIVTSQERGVLLVPNGALRYRPEKPVEAKGGIGLGMRPPPSAPKQTSISRGSRQTLYLLGADNRPRAVEVIVGASDGTRTIVSGRGIKAGDRVITGELAAKG